MQRHIKILLVFLVASQIHAQRLYRFNDHGKTATKAFDLIDTKLNLSFNFEDQTVNGEAWLTLTPYFKSTKKIQLDAKKMNIYEVKNKNTELKFYNSGTKLNIEFPRMYTKNDTITIYIKYRGNPNQIQNHGGVAITDNKGLYFINPRGVDTTKPVQVWTQGEPEQNSVWFPTIDKPNQKSTQEISLTVPSKFVTLSNGSLVSQQENENGTRTDVWKQILPHAPYLFFVGIGEFAVIKQVWRGKEVNFYVEPSYKETAQELFKNTTEMLSYFSKITGVEYPWDKYSQMIVRDYVSGAMENTGAVIHAEQAMLSDGELMERNTWEPTIAHELFHHWFGDLVTTESWANITVNESFANYSEYLWLHHKYGPDRAEEHMQKTRSQYLNPSALKENYEKHLVRYNYSKKDDVFDVVSYNKGGMILHLLRNYLGDDVFFKGLQLYLEKNKFKAAEAQQLRLAFEEVGGEDLVWFFSQWYYSNGHPRLKVSYENDYISQKVKVKISQSGKEFDFPLAIKVYEEETSQKYKVFVDRKEKIFEFPFKKAPKLIKINSDHVLLAEIIEPDLSNKQLVFQYRKSDHYVDKIESLELLKNHQDEKNVFKLFQEAMNDSYETIQSYALEHIDLSGSFAKKSTIKKIVKLSESDNPNVKAAAISTLGKLVDSKFLPIYIEGIKHNSPKVKGNSLLSMYYVDKVSAEEYAAGLSAEIKDYIYVPLLKIYLEQKKPEQVNFVAKYLLTGMYMVSDDTLMKSFKSAFDWVASTDDKEAIVTLVDDFVEKGLRYRKYNFNYTCIEMLRKIIVIQKTLNHKHKNAIVAILEQGIEQLAVE